MKKASLLASAALATLALASTPVFAQGPFADVPTDHWAYAAVDTLQKKGIVIGYPDQTYGGKRPMTRYEFAMAISRLLQLPGGGKEVDLTPYVLKTDLGDYVKKGDLADYAKKSDLEAYATKEDVATLRKMVDEFKAELVAFGVDLDAIKKRLDDLEKRVKAIEDELKRLRITGELSTYVRGNHRNNTDLAGGGVANSVRDASGFLVTNPTNGNALADTRVTHDLDVTLNARLSDKAIAKATLNFGNYLPYLGSIASFSGVRSSRSGFTGGNSFTDNVGIVNQNQDLTVYEAYVQTSIGVPIIGKTGIMVGRVPMQLTPYTLKLIDTDYYTENRKTDNGDVPLDGLHAKFNLGPVGFTLIAAKADPIKFVSNLDGVITGGGGSYGLFAGAGMTPFGNFPSDNNTALNTGLRSRPFQSTLGAPNGAMAVENIGAARVELNISKIAKIGGTFMALGGRSARTPLEIFNLRDPGEELELEVADDVSFNRVTVYGADLSTNFLFGIGITASYTKSDTEGDSLVQGRVQTGQTKIDGENDAFDINASKSFGSFYLEGGFRQVAPFFAAPGYWGRIGSWTNPVDIKGPYGTVKLNLSKRLVIGASGQFYEGTGDAILRGGLSEDDKITNFRGFINFGLSTANNVDLGIEVTEWETLNFNDEESSDRLKPRETWINLGYSHMFNDRASTRIGYQFITYDDKDSGFDPLNGDGGVATFAYRIKF